MRCQSLTLITRSVLLLLFLLLSGVADVEVAELVGLGVGSDDTDPITDAVFLEELLGKVLQVLLGEASSAADDNLVTLTLDSHGLAEVAGLALDLDALLEESLESSNIKDLVLCRAGAVDGADHLSNLRLRGHVRYTYKKREKKNKKG